MFLNSVRNTPRPLKYSIDWCRLHLLELTQSIFLQLTQLRCLLLLYTIEFSPELGNSYIYIQRSLLWLYHRFLENSSRLLFLTFIHHKQHYYLVRGQRYPFIHFDFRHAIFVKSLKYSNYFSKYLRIASNMFEHTFVCNSLWMVFLGIS